MKRNLDLTKTCLFLCSLGILGWVVTDEMSASQVTVGKEPGQVTMSDHGMAPASLAGCELSYRDLHGSYTYILHADGTYRFAAIHQSGKKEEGRHGSYRYVVTAPNKATLSVDTEDTFQLTFKSARTGIGTTDDDVRPFAFTITKGSSN